MFDRPCDCDFLWPSSSSLRGEEHEDWWRNHLQPARVLAVFGLQKRPTLSTELHQCQRRPGRGDGKTKTRSHLYLQSEKGSKVNTQGLINPWTWKFSCSFMSGCSCNVDSQHFQFIPVVKPHKSWDQKTRVKKCIFITDTCRCSEFRSASPVCGAPALIWWLQSSTQTAEFSVFGQSTC